MDWNS